MQAEKMKNMIVLKNLPSNIVDEAIIILKNNKKTKALSKLENKAEAMQEKDKAEEYIVKEAEMLISNYVSKYEDEKKIKSYATKQIEYKYKRLKLVSIVLGIIATILIIF